MPLLILIFYKSLLNVDNPVFKQKITIKLSKFKCFLFKSFHFSNIYNFVRSFIQKRMGAYAKRV